MTRPAETQSVRLIFEYSGDDVRLVYQSTVDVAPDGPQVSAESGEHVEVRAADESLLSRVRVRPGLTSSAEVFPERPDEPIVRTDLDEVRGAFTVVVAAPQDADHVSVVRIDPGRIGRGGVDLAPGPPPPPAGREVVELASFPLDRGDR